MGLTDPRGVRAPNAIAGALQAGGQLRVVLGADGALKAESDAPPITLPETGASTSEFPEAAATAEGHAPDLTPDEVLPPGPRIGFDGRPLAAQRNHSGASVLGGDITTIAAGLGHGSGSC